MIATSTGFPVGCDAELAVAEERDRADVTGGQAVRGDQLVRGGAQLGDRVRQIHEEHLRGVLQALQVIPQAEHRRALLGLVAADSLEDARPVVEPVDADVDLRVRPVDELAVHPDLVGLLHRVSAPSRARRRS